MEPSDMLEVFKRLGQRAARFLDERDQEMPLPDHWNEEPLFMQKKPSNV